MNKPTEKAKVLDVCVHKGSLFKSLKKKKSSRGRKAKKGRAVITIQVTLMPSEVQKTLLENDLALFNYFYKDTIDRLSSAKPVQDKKGMWLSYSPSKRRVKWTISKKNQGIVHQTPRYIMAAQASIWGEYQWMQECTYQVLYRATTNAFSEYLKPKEERRFQIDGNKYEAKIKYGIRNGHLVMKKFGELIRIKETGLPKGSLETVLLTYKSGEWTAELEILEPFDKVLDIQEDGAMLETDTISHTILEKDRDQIFKRQATRFRKVANHVIKHKFEDRKEAQKETKNVFEDIVNGDLFNMACIAGAARVKGFNSNFVETVPKEYAESVPITPDFEAPKLRKTYFAISEGFTIEGKHLKIPILGIDVLLSGSMLSWCNLEYIVIYESKKDKWKVAGKKRKRNILRSFKEMFREFDIQQILTRKKRLPF